MTWSLIDIGANLAHDSFDDDRDEMMQRAADAGVIRIIVTGSSEQSNVAAAELAGSAGDEEEKANVLTELRRIRRARRNGHDRSGEENAEITIEAEALAS